MDDAKVRLGADYLHLMAIACVKSGVVGPGFTSLPALMLCWDWGFSGEEIAKSYELSKDIEIKENLEHYSEVANLIVLGLKENSDVAKNVFITNMAMAMLSDGPMADDAVDFLLFFVKGLGINNWDYPKMLSRAIGLVVALNWYVEGCNK
jgi:hypothetical protein